MYKKPEYYDCIMLPRINKAYNYYFLYVKIKADFYNGNVLCKYRYAN